MPSKHEWLSMLAHALAHNQVNLLPVLLCEHATLLGLTREYLVEQGLEQLFRFWKHESIAEAMAEACNLLDINSALLISSGCVEAAISRADAATFAWLFKYCSLAAAHHTCRAQWLLRAAQEDTTFVLDYEQLVDEETTRVLSNKLICCSYTSTRQQLEDRLSAQLDYKGLEKTPSWDSAFVQPHFEGQHLASTIV